MLKIATDMWSCDDVWHCAHGVTASNENYVWLCETWRGWSHIRMQMAAAQKKLRIITTKIENTVSIWHCIPISTQYLLSLIPTNDC